MLITRYKKLTSLFVLFSITYVVLSLILPQDKAAMAKYKLSNGQYIALIIMIVAPYVIIWFIALIGCLRFRAYSDTISGSKDGDAFKSISAGILWLALWLPVSSLISTATSGYYRAHPSSTALMINLSNYSGLAILLLALWLVHRGSYKILALIKKPEASLPQLLMFIYIGFSAFYVLLVLKDPARQFPTHNVHVATYYLPDWLTITTIIIPRLIIWFTGIQAVYNIYLYRKKVKGPIYKKAFDNLAKGLGGVVVTLVLLNFFQTISSQLARLSLGPILLVIYILFIVMSGGYIFISKGARSLQQIEEI